MVSVGELVAMNDFINESPMYSYKKEDSQQFWFFAAPQDSTSDILLARAGIFQQDDEQNVAEKSVRNEHTVSVGYGWMDFSKVCKIIEPVSCHPGKIHNPQGWQSGG